MNRNKAIPSRKLWFLWQILWINFLTFQFAGKSEAHFRDCWSRLKSKMVGNKSRGIGDASRNLGDAVRRDAFVAFRTAYVSEAPSGIKVGAVWFYSRLICILLRKKNLLVNRDRPKNYQNRSFVGEKVPILCGGSEGKKSVECADHIVD